MFLLQPAAPVVPNQRSLKTSQLVQGAPGRLFDGAPEKLLLHHQESPDDRKEATSDPVYSRSVKQVRRPSRKRRYVKLLLSVGPTTYCSTLHIILSANITILVLLSRCQLPIAYLDKWGEGGEARMLHHHFPKIHCCNDDVILSNIYGHQTSPLPTYENPYLKRLIKQAFFM